MDPRSSIDGRQRLSSFPMLAEEAFDFSNKDCTASLVYFCNRYKGRPDLKSKLFESFYTHFKKSNFTVQEFKDCFVIELNISALGDKLLECFLFHGDGQFCKAVIQVMNHQNMLPMHLSKVNAERLLPFFQDALRRKDTSDVSLFLSMFAREGNYNKTVCEELLIEDLNPKAGLISDFLEGAFLVDNKKIFRVCTLVLFQSIHNFAFNQSRHSEVYTQVRPIKGLKKWVVSILCKENRPVSNKPIESTLLEILSVSVLYPRFDDSEDFVKCIEEEIKGLADRDKAHFILQLMRDCIYSHEDEVVNSVFGLVDHFKLYNSPYFKKAMMPLLCEIWLFNQKILQIFNATIIKFPFPQGANVTLALLDEYLSPPPEDLHTYIFILLDMGVRSRIPHFANRCLISIEENQLQRFMPPNLACGMLLQAEDSEHKILGYQRNTTILLREVIDETQVAQIVTLPKCILDARAPKFLEDFNKLNISKAQLFRLLRFIACPDYTCCDAKTDEELLEFYQFAKKMKMVRLFLGIEHQLFNGKVQFSKNQIPLLIGFFKSASGDFKTNLRDIILALVLANRMSRNYLVEMEEHSPGTFLYIEVLRYFKTAEIYTEAPNDKNKRSIRSVEGFGEIPGLEHLDVEDISCLKDVRVNFKGLGSIHRLGFETEVEILRRLGVTFLKLNFLEAYTFKLIERLPLTEMEFRFDRHWFDIESLLIWANTEQGKKFLGNLKVLNISSRDKNTKVIESLAPFLTNLVELRDKTQQMQPASLDLMKRLLPNLRSFHATLSENVSLEQLNAFLSHYFTLADLSLKFKSQIRSNGSRKIEVQKLRSLCLKGQIDEALLLQTLASQEDLEELEIKISTRKLSKETLASIGPLPNLAGLKLNVMLPLKDLMELTDKLPNLKSLTVPADPSDHLMIREVMLQRDVEVTFINNRR